MGTDLAIIGGSGFYHLQDPEAPASLFETPYDPTPVALHREHAGDAQVWFLARHGRAHLLPPHAINYRANLHALHQAGARRIIAVNAVGGIHPALTAGTLLVPEQLIDYTWGREHSFFDGGGLRDHIDFTQPYSPPLRQVLLRSCQSLGLWAHDGGVYGCTQGPRLETAAEIRRLKADGCDVVGMTGMPEAALARELGLAYASLCLVVNAAAGLRAEPVSLDEIGRVLHDGAARIRHVLLHAVATLSTGHSKEEKEFSGSGRS